MKQEDDLLSPNEESQVVCPIAIFRNSDRCDKMDFTESGGSESEETVEYCWCSECNADFVSRKDLWNHLKEHRHQSPNEGNHSKATSSTASSVELGLISGEISLLKNELCCGKCLRQFRNRSELVRHIEKYGFNCEANNLKELNRMLKSLQSITKEDSIVSEGVGSSSCSELNIYLDSKFHGHKPTIHHTSSLCPSTSLSKGCLSPENSTSSSADNGSGKKLKNAYAISVTQGKEPVISIRISSHTTNNSSSLNPMKPETCDAPPKSSCFLSESVDMTSSPEDDIDSEFEVHDQPSVLNNSLLIPSSSPINNSSSCTGDNPQCKSNISYPFCDGQEKEPDVSRRKSSRIRDHPSTSSSAKQEFGNDPSKSCRGNRKKGGGKNGAGIKGRGLGPLKVALFENLTPVKRDIVVCDYCNKSHTSKARLKEHIVLYHQTAVVHKCTICGNIFPTESDLVDHKAIHTSKCKYICSMCDHSCTSRKGVKSHLREVHDVMNGFVCGTCFLFMPSRAELGLHQACHSGEKKHECSKCGKAWLSKVWFDAHVRSCQLGKVEHKCGVCGKEFKIKGDLTTHSFTHGSVKGFPCSLCPKTFTQSSRLNVHVRNFHLKLKPHECGICGKRFAVKRYLLYHHAVHTDSRPFSCELCGKTFKLKFQVGVHKNKMH